MSCDLAGYLMDDYLEDDLSDHDRQRLEKHLASCPGARVCAVDWFSAQRAPAL
jgi:anti-sigma factor RsiW